MTEEQKAAITALRRCTFPPASFDKRFVRGLAERMDADPAAALSQKQSDCLMEKLHRYRRQHRACGCAECQKN